MSLILKTSYFIGIECLSSSYVNEDKLVQAKLPHFVWFSVECSYLFIIQQSIYMIFAARLDSNQSYQNKPGFLVPSCPCLGVVVWQKHAYTITLSLDHNFMQHCNFVHVHNNLTFLTLQHGGHVPKQTYCVNCQTKTHYHSFSLSSCFNGHCSFELTNAET